MVVEEPGPTRFKSVGELSFGRRFESGEDRAAGYQISDVAETVEPQQEGTAPDAQESAGPRALPSVLGFFGHSASDRSAIGRVHRDVSRSLHRPQHFTELKRS